MGQDMKSRRTKQDQLPPAPVRRSLVERAVGILAVDGIKVSDRARELLSQCEAGTLTFDQARKEIITRALAMAAAKNVKQGD